MWRRWSSWPMVRDASLRAAPHHEVVLASGLCRLPIIDIHTHCAPRPTDDRFGVAAAMRGTPVGRNVVTNYRDLPAVSYHEMTDFDLQQEVSARAGITHRILSNPF